MPVSTTNQTDIGYSLETVPGTINTSPAFTIIPTTGGSPSSNITTARSEVIRSDRQTTELIKTDSDVNGEISYELDYPNYRPLIESLLIADNAGVAISQTALTLTTATSKLAAAGIEGLVEVGDVFWMSSVTNPDNDMARVVTSTSVADEITFGPAVPSGTTDAATDLVMTTTKILKNGSDTSIDSYTLRKRIIDSTTYAYYYNGCMINTMSWNIATGSILNGSIGIVGLTESIGTGTLSGETTVASTAYSIMNATSSVKAVVIGGVDLGICKFNKLDLTYDNQINLAKSVGTEGACASAAFSLNITGSAETYFSNQDVYQSFLDSTSFSVTLILQDSDNNVIGLNMPYCKWENLDSAISGRDSFLMQSGSFTALMDPTLGYMFKASFIDAV